MLKEKKYTFIDGDGSNDEILSRLPLKFRKSNERKNLLKKDLINVFQKYGYLVEKKNCEIRIRTTSGNIAWINIHSMETIK